MSYKTLVESNVRKAFNLVKDLAEDIVFVKKLSGSFNFGTLEAKTSSSENIGTKGIITESNQKSEVHNAMSKSIMLKTQDIGDITAYDSILRGEDPWKLGPIIYSDGYVTIVEIHKEV